MKVFVTGVEGQLGYDVMKELIKRNYEVIGSDVKEKSFFSPNYIKLDITDEDCVKNAIAIIMPDAVIHCAAWTASESISLQIFLLFP